VEGVQSHLFGLTVIFALVVMYDSFGVRRSSGEQAALINDMLDNLERHRFRFDTPPTKLREILGHQPKEVVVGALLGIVLGALFNYEKLGAINSFVTVVPVRLELYIMAGIFAALVLGGIIARLILGRRYKKSQVMKKFNSRLFTLTQTIGWVGLVLSVLMYERASYLAWRLWPILLGVIALVWLVSLIVSARRELPRGLAAEAEARRKEKWLKSGKKTR
jgi:hypothetical protein